LPFLSYGVSEKPPNDTVTIAVDARPKLVMLIYADSQ